MEREAVIVMMLGQQPEILDGPGRIGLEELELDGPRSVR